MDPLIFADAKAILGPSPGNPSEESNSIEILGLQKQCFLDSLVRFAKRGKWAISPMSLMFRVAALALKKLADSSLFCRFALGMYVACWRRLASAIVQPRVGRQWHAILWLGTECGGVRRLYLRMCRQVGAEVATMGTQTARYCPGSWCSRK
eukprot:6197480-Pleurochrysis_carterae.AAC.1